MVVLVVAAVALHNPQHHGKTAGGTDKPGPEPTSSVPAPGTSASRHGSAGSGHTTAGHTSAGHTSTPPSSASSGSSADLIGALPLVVLNDTEITGLAAGAAQRFENGGWTATYGNLPPDVSDILSTCAYFDPSVANAKAVARALQAQYPTIKRVKPKFEGLPAGPIVVVLTPDYSPGT